MLVYAFALLSRKRSLILSGLRVLRWILCITICNWIRPPLQDPIVSPKLHISNPLQVEDSRWDILNLYHAVAKIQSSAWSKLQKRYWPPPCAVRLVSSRIRIRLELWNGLLARACVVHMRDDARRRRRCIIGSVRDANSSPGKGRRAQGDNPVRWIGARICGLWKHIVYQLLFGLWAVGVLIKKNSCMLLLLVCIPMTVSRTLEI